MKIGVAGCGRMGLGMARAMRRGGLDVTGFDVRPPDAFGDFAPFMMPDPSLFAADREIIFSVVRDVAQTEALLFDEQRIMAGRQRPQYLVICSTLSPRYFQDLSSRIAADVRVVDAPMSGAQIAADEARLSFMLGGADADLDVLEPVLRTMGTRIHRMGGPGAGMTAKVLNNFVAASSAAATRQVIDWAQDLSIDRDRLFRMIHDSSGQNWFLSNFDDIEFSRDGYEAENTIGILKKDLESCLDAVDPRSHDGLPKALVAAVSAFKPI